MRYFFFFFVLVLLGILGTLGIYLRFLFVLLSLFVHFLKEGFLFLVNFPALTPQEKESFEE